MTITLENKSAVPLDMWLSMAGPLYWDNNVKPGEKNDHHPGWVFFTVNAKLNIGPDGELSNGRAAMQNGLPFASVFFLPAGGPILAGLISGWIIATQKGLVANSSILPAQLKEAFDAGAVSFDQNIQIAPVEWTKVYGGGDKTFTVTGGDPIYTSTIGADGKKHYRVTGMKPLKLDKTRDD